jgi:acyl-CoA synthetase (AMP-forming)/AMP-acid ligase II
MLSHRNMLVSLEHVGHRDGLSSADSEISHTRLHYSSHDLMHPLAIGSRMFLLSDREAMFPEYIGEVMEREGATVWRSTVTALRLLLEAGEFERRDLRKLRLVRSFGERLSVELLQRLRAALPQTRIGTSYGATEAYGMASLEFEPSCDDGPSSVPLGSVADSYKLSLCDHRGNEVAPGEIGEICVAGPMVMLGYWSDPELTAARRLPGRPDSFRTGDLGHVGEDGLLYLTGRKDHMVKLRGHRFDLGEIEAVLKRHPGVRDAVAFLFKHDGNNPEVRAAILAEQGPALQDGLKVLCAKNLPVYARPARFLVLDDFPMLPTAKIDRQALQALLA